MGKQVAHYQRGIWFHLCKLTFTFVPFKAHKLTYVRDIKIIHPCLVQVKDYLKDNIETLSNPFANRDTASLKD